MSARRPWLFAVGGAVVATAATVAVVAAVGGSPQNTADPDPATSQSPTEEPAPTEDSRADRADRAEWPAGDPQRAPATVTLPALLRRRHAPGPAPVPRVPRGRRAASRGSSPSTHRCTGAALDPDYRTLWPAGVQRPASASPTATDHRRPHRRRPARPPGGHVAGADAKLAAAAGRLHAPRRSLEQGGSRCRSSARRRRHRPGPGQSRPSRSRTPPAHEDPRPGLGQQPCPRARPCGDRFIVSGVANSFEATVPWEIRQGDRVVAKASPPRTAGWTSSTPGPRRSTSRSWPPAPTRFAAMTDDPSGGAEGAGPTEDTKTIVVE